MRAATAIIRQSRSPDRNGNGPGTSPADQLKRIEAICEAEALELVHAPIEEIDVSGGKPLAKRTGLTKAIEEIEAGKAEVLVVAFFDRLVRSLPIQAEIVDRVEKAGGSVLAADTGAITAKSAGQWLSGSVLGLVAEYQRRTTRERVREHQVKSVKAGVAPQPHVPAGLRRSGDGRFEVDPETGPVMRQAFEMVAAGRSIMEARRYANEHGVPLSYYGLYKALHNPAYIGVVRFGELENRNAHEPLVDAVTFRRVQRLRHTGGKHSKAPQLLARLGVLRCGSCDSAMAVGTSGNAGKHKSYRCSAPAGECPNRMSIACHVADGAVVEATKQALADNEGKASIGDKLDEAQSVLTGAQATLDALIRIMDPLEPVAQDRLQEATAARDAAERTVTELGGHVRAAETFRPALEWDDDVVTDDDRRGWISTVIDSAVVGPGRGNARVTVKPHG
jgi:DNA invertase Pin-like site-specific DNA recombinase